MSTTLRIAEVAQRSGFTPATLRYYEDIGLLEPARRTDAGYRLYDETSLARLRFIARAKQLGCSLDEIADLTSVWDGGRCATVQARLRATVEGKIIDAHAQIAALTALAAELRTAAVALAAAPVDGPCDATCACTTDAPAVSPTAVPLVARADAPPPGAIEGICGAAHTAGRTEAADPTDAAGRTDDEVPVACTLGAGAMSSRLDEWNALLTGEQDVLRGVTSRLALDDGGLRLEFGANADVTEIARLAAAEQGCCRFFTFALVIDGRGTALEVNAPEDGRPVLTTLFGAPG